VYDVALFTKDSVVRMFDTFNARGRVANTLIVIETMPAEPCGNQFK